MENWKDIAGYEGKYQVSNHGAVKSMGRVAYHSKKGAISIVGCIRKFGIAKGYRTVTLISNGIRKQFQVHRLVAAAFISNPHSLPIVNHRDGNKLNNCVDNLIWCTQKENIIHAIDTGLNKHIKRCGVIVSDMNGNFIGRFVSQSDAAMVTGSDKSKISACCRGIRNKHNNLVFSYS